MRTHSTTLRDATDEVLIANLKKFLVEQAETVGSSGEGGCAAGGRSPFGGKTSFSPKKPKQADSRPAVLARNGWVITIDRRRGIVARRRRATTAAAAASRCGRALRRDAHGDGSRRARRRAAAAAAAASGGAGRRDARLCAARLGRAGAARGARGGGGTTARRSLPP